MILFVYLFIYLEAISGISGFTDTVKGVVVVVLFSCLCHMKTTVDVNLYPERFKPPLKCYT